MSDLRLYSKLYTFEYAGAFVKQREFVRWLERQGATFKDGSRHMKVYLNGRQTILPRHPGKEISNVMVLAIKKQLNIQEET